jgi:hypothetical protein
MKNLALFFLAILLGTTNSRSQTAMQFSGLDCNGNYVDLFADLDAGKAVVLFFFMPNCGACPPPAQVIQLMANDVNQEYPDFVKGYAFPFNDTIGCAEAIDWAATSFVDHFFIPMDSAEAMITYYGGFGMPTVVLLGGLDHRVMFSTQSFLTNDTTIMNDSIMALYSQLNGVGRLTPVVSSFDVFPNPADEHVNINMELNEQSHLLIDIADITGKQIGVVMNETVRGRIKGQFNTGSLPEGNYFVRLQVSEKTISRKFTVFHE